MPTVNIKRLTFWFFLMALLLVIGMRAQADELVQVTLTADREEMAVGDPVLLTLEVNHPAGYQVIIPKLEQMWDDFEVRGQSQATTVANDDGTETTSQTIEVTLFSLGEFKSPGLPLTISDGAGGVTEEMMPSISLTVNPTLAEDDTTLRDIKPQAGLSVPATWPWIVGGLFVAAILAVGGWWAYRRWQGKPFLAPAVDNRPPWQVAYDELARIEGLGLLEQGRVKAYYTLVTDCLRTYLESQFDLHVHDRTTYQLRAIFRQSDLAPEFSRRFLDLFMESDLVKFAKFKPDLETARQLTIEARSLVDGTRPQPEPEASATEPTPKTPEAKPQLSYQSRPLAGRH